MLPVFFNAYIKYIRKSYILKNKLQYMGIKGFKIYIWIGEWLFPFKKMNYTLYLLYFKVIWFLGIHFTFFFFPFSFKASLKLEAGILHIWTKMLYQKSMFLRHYALGSCGMLTEQIRQPLIEIANQPFGFVSSQLQWNVCHDFRPKWVLVCLDD